LEGEHTVVHRGETGGDRLVRPWVRGDDRFVDNDIAAWRLTGYLSLWRGDTWRELIVQEFEWFQISKGMDRFKLWP
jgi:hypothetical protein